MATKELWVAQLLSVFGGFLGLDRFYLNQIWQPILKIVTLGGFGIWYTVDLLILAIQGIQRKTDSILSTGVQFKQNSTGFYLGIAIVTITIISVVVAIISNVVKKKPIELEPATTE